MRWNNKKRKIFIFIVSLLFILQAVAIIGSARGSDPSIKTDPTDPNVDTTSLEENTGDVTDKDGDTSTTKSGSTSQNYFVPNYSNYYSTIITPSSEVPGGDTQLDPKYETYATALNSNSEESVDIISSYYEETNVLEVSVISEGGETVPDATVTIINQKYTTDYSGKILAPIPPEIDENTDSVLVEANTINGHSAIAYASLNKEQKKDTDDAFLEFIRQIDSQVLRNIFMMLIQINN